MLSSLLASFAILPIASAPTTWDELPYMNSSIVSCPSQVASEAPVDVYVEGTDKDTNRAVNPGVEVGQLDWNVSPVYPPGQVYAASFWDYAIPATNPSTGYKKFKLIGIAIKNDTTETITGKVFFDMIDNVNPLTLKKDPNVRTSESIRVTGVQPPPGGGGIGVPGGGG